MVEEHGACEVRRPPDQDQHMGLRESTCAVGEAPRDKSKRAFEGRQAGGVRRDVR